MWKRSTSSINVAEIARFQLLVLWNSLQKSTRWCPHHHWPWCFIQFNLKNNEEMIERLFNASICFIFKTFSIFSSTWKNNEEMIENAISYFIFKALSVKEKENWISSDCLQWKIKNKQENFNSLKWVKEKEYFTYQYILSQNMCKSFKVNLKSDILWIFKQLIDLDKKICLWWKKNHISILV